MKNKLLPILAIIFTISCNSENVEPCEGLVLDEIAQTLYIELLDSNNNNLIENGTYNKEDISTLRNGFVANPVVYDESDIFVPQELQNQIVVRVFGNEGDDNVVIIKLNDSEEDTLTMELKIESEGCSGRFYEIIEITYNGMAKEFTDLGENNYRITVIKQ